MSRAFLPLRRPATALALAAALVAARPAAAQLGDSRTRAEPTVRGVVVDHETGRPLPDAAVTLGEVGGRGGDLGTRLTDAQGRFLFPRVPAGLYLMRAALLGRETVTDTLRVEADADLRLAVEMAEEPIPLEPLVIVARRREDPLTAEGFDFRRERLHGTFVTREDVEERNPVHVSDLLRMVPGAIFVPGAGGGFEMRLLRGTTLLGGPCRPPTYVDGVLIDGDLGVDTFLSPESVEAIEVYTSAAETPPQFTSFGGASCGAVVVWTRAFARVDEGYRPPEGRGWKTVALVAGMLGLGFLVTH